jgi:hypothetical protein
MAETKKEATDMSEEIKEEKKVVKKKTTTSTKNKDGFEKGQLVSDKDYFTHMAKLRQKK